MSYCKILKVVQKFKIRSFLECANCLSFYDNWVSSSLIFRFTRKVMELMKTIGSQLRDWGIARN